MIKMSAKPSLRIVVVALQVHETRDFFS